MSASTSCIRSCCDDGWTFATDFPGATGDSLFGADFLRDIYLRADPKANGRVTVPVLWDRETGTIVSNESAEIIRMFNSAFDGLTGNRDDYWPESLRAEIEAVNARIYRGGQQRRLPRRLRDARRTAYDEAAAEVFETLDGWSGASATGAGCSATRSPRPTGASRRRCSASTRSITATSSATAAGSSTIPNLWAYARALYQQPGVAETVNFDHITTHYYSSHRSLNPTGIVPLGPDIDWTAPHGR